MSWSWRWCPFLSWCPSLVNTYVHQKIRHALFTAVVFIGAPNWKLLKCQTTQTTVRVKWQSLCRVRLCNSMNCSWPGSSVHGILQARILEWVALPFSRGSSRPRRWTCVSLIAGRLFSVWATRKPYPNATNSKTGNDCGIFTQWIPCSIYNEWSGDFLAGPMVKNPPCNAGDMGSIPGPGTKIP